MPCVHRRVNAATAKWQKRMPRVVLSTRHRKMNAGGEARQTLTLHGWRAADFAQVDPCSTRLQWDFDRGFRFPPCPFALAISPHPRRLVAVAASSAGDASDLATSPPCRRRRPRCPRCFTLAPRCLAASPLSPSLPPPVASVTSSAPVGLCFTTAATGMALGRVCEFGAAPIATGMALRPSLSPSPLSLPLPLPPSLPSMPPHTAVAVEGYET